MRVAFDSFNRFEQPQISICNIGCTFASNNTQDQYLLNGILSNTVGILNGAEDMELIANFNEMSQCNFRVYEPAKGTDAVSQHNTAMYNALKNRRLLFINPYGFFQIDSLDVGYDGVKSYKDITAESIEIELQNKTVPFIEDNTYAFTDLLETIVGVTPLWLIGHIDTAVAEKFRTFEDVSTEQNVLAFMLEDMQEAYECIFVFDTVNRIINVYDQNNYVVQTNIHLTKDDLINSFTVRESTDDLYTALLVHGVNNLNISPVNPLGGNTIYNFDYYLDWMTPGLREKVEDWKEAVADQVSPYRVLSIAYYQATDTVATQDAEIARLENVISLYRRCKENIVAESGYNGTSGDISKAYSNLASYNSALAESGASVVEVASGISENMSEIDGLIATANTALSAAQSARSSAESIAQQKQTAMDAISDELMIENYFTLAEYEELANYIFQGDYTDEYIMTLSSMTYEEKFVQYQTLYDRAVGQLERISAPRQEFTVDVENFIFDKAFKDWSEDLETGCLVNVESGEDDISSIFLCSIAVNYEDQTLSLTFGNRFNKYDPRSLYEDVLGDVKKSANALNYVKEIIYPIKQGELEYVKSILENSRNLTKNNAIAANNQSVVIDDTGYSGRRIINGDIDDKQVKITNNTMVFTDDAWETCKVALGEIALDEDNTVYGLNAETLIGNIIIGNELHILSADDDNQTIFDVINGNIRSAITQSETSVTSDILGNVSENYATKDYVETINQTLSSSVEMNAGSITAAVSRIVNAEDAIGSLEDSTNTRFSTIDNYMTFDLNGLTIGKSNSTVKLRLENNIIQFLDNNTPVASWTDSTFTITNAEIKEQLKLGKFGFIPRANGNLDFKVVDNS